VIEKRQDGSVGLNLSVAGLFILTVCEDLSVKSGCCLEPGDEVLAINGVEVDGMSDMEAHALLAKCEQCVELEIVKGAFLWRVQHLGDQPQQCDVKKRHKVCTPQVSTENDAALQRAKIEMDEALMELRRSTSASYKESQQFISKQRENCSPLQSLTSSIEVHESITEGDFVVIDSSEVTEGYRRAQTNDQTLQGSKINKGGSESKGGLIKTKNSVGSADIYQTNKSGQVKIQNSMNDFISSQSTSELLGAKFDLNSSQSVPVSIHDQQSMRQGLSLLLLSSAGNVPRRTSPPDDRNRASSFTSLKTVCTSAKVPQYEKTIQNTTSSSCSAYCIPHDGKVAQFTSSYIDRDKVSPPPSYQVASQIFNTQKPGARGDTTDQKPNLVGLVNGYSSQDSSFDEIESILPSVLQKPCRDSRGIDQHVLRYMTKKYSEPRLQTLSARNGVITPTINGARSTPQVTRASEYIGSPYPVTERAFMTQTPLRATLSGEVEARDTIASNKTWPTLKPVASLPIQSFGQASPFSTLGSSGYSYIGDEDHIVSGTLPLGDTSDTNAVQMRIKGPEQPIRPHLDYNCEMLPPNGEDGLKISPRIAPASQQRKAISGSRLAKLHRQRIACDSSSERMRRATSSPSVNSEHEKSGSVESDADLTSDTKNLENSRSTRRMKDGFSDRRKSIDSGSLRKLKAELQANHNLCEDFPMLSKLLGGAGLQELQTSTSLPRYGSSDALPG